MIFQSLQDFISHKTICPLCGQTLFPIIFGTGSTVKTKEIPEINVSLTDDAPIVKLHYTSPQTSIDVQCTISLKNNLFSFEKEYSSQDLQQISEIFNNLYPVILLKCKNTKCVHNYVHMSSVLKSYVDGIYNQIKIKSIMADMESFYYGSYWICNDLINQNAKVYLFDSEGMNLPPINIPFLTNLNAQNKTKVLNRISTFITFS